MKTNGSYGPVLGMAALIAGIFLWSPAFSAEKILLKLEFVPGESTIPRYEGYIELLAFTEGVSQSGTTHIAAGGGAGKASFNDLKVTKKFDKSSVVLRSYTASGRQLPEGRLVVLDLDDAGGVPIEKFVIKLEKILITSIGAVASNEGVVENVSINFGKIIWQYSQDSGEGPAGPPITAGWDIQQNIPADR